MDRLLTKSLINILVDLPDNADVVAAHDVEPKNNLGRNFDIKLQLQLLLRVYPV